MCRLFKFTCYSVLFIMQLKIREQYINHIQIIKWVFAPLVAAKTKPCQTASLCLLSQSFTLLSPPCSFIPILSPLKYHPCPSCHSPHLLRLIFFPFLLCRQLCPPSLSALLLSPITICSLLFSLQFLLFLPLRYALLSFLVL